MLKRLFDIVVSLVFLIVISPFFLLISLLILLSDGRPIFYNQDRLGKDATIFKFHKFRSMTNNPERKLNQQVRDSDPDVLPIGVFIRRLKLDELPQFWNVLKGEMSIVGPRPALPQYLKGYSPRQRRRLEVRGGITCLAQIKGGSFLSWDERIEYDIVYIDNQSFWNDLKIIFRTVPVVLLGEKRYISHPDMEQDGSKEILEEPN
jgi:lipopolysaccharide/colanic/teichoic acid biosynthesis glycosyltransferase